MRDTVDRFREIINKHYSDDPDQHARAWATFEAAFQRLLKVVFFRVDIEA